MAEKQDVTAKNGSFFSNMVAELKKVVWPTGSQTAKGTGTVIIFVLVVTAILVALNLVFEAANQKYWEAVNPNKVEPAVVETLDTSSEETTEDTTVETVDEGSEVATTEESVDTTEVSE